MVIKKSKLQFQDLVILQSNYKFLSPKGKPQDFNFESLQEKYVIDVDFGFRKETHGIYIFAKISVNENNDHLDGYQIFVEGSGFIDLKDLKSISKEQLKEFVNIPGLNILFNYLRAYISNITAYAPFGKYLLPAIDLGDLLRAKAEKISASANSSKGHKKLAKKKSKLKN